MRALVLGLLLSSCLDVVEHGNTVLLNLKTTDCDGVSVIAGATQLRFTANDLPARTISVGAIPRSLALPATPDAHLQVDAVDGSGRLIARGTSVHFSVPAIAPVEVQLFAAGKFGRVCNNLNTARAFHTATPLADDRLLIVGGEGTGGEALSSMELISGSEIRELGPLAMPAQGGPVKLPRARHTATLTPVGQVVISGGESASALLSTVLFIDPASDFAIGALRPPNTPRSRHAAFTVGTDIFLIGGNTRALGQTVANPKVERIVLPRNELETAFELSAPRLDSAIAVAGSTAIIAGGLGNAVASAEVELISLSSTGFARSSLVTARSQATAVAVGDRVLIAGGLDRFGAAIGSTEWIAVNTASVEPGPVTRVLGVNCATPLQPGRVLLVGGGNAAVVFADGTVSEIVFPGRARKGQRCVAMEDGSVIVSGGIDSGGRVVGELWRFVDGG